MIMIFLERGMRVRHGAKVYLLFFLDIFQKDLFQKKKKKTPNTQTVLLLLGNPDRLRLHFSYD